MKNLRISSNPLEKARGEKCGLILAVTILLIGSVKGVDAKVETQFWYHLGEEEVGQNNLPIDSAAGQYNFREASGAAATRSDTPPSLGNPASNQYEGSSSYYWFNGHFGYYYNNEFKLPDDNFGIEVFARSGDLSQSGVIFATGGHQGIQLRFDESKGYSVCLVGHPDVCIGTSYMPSSIDEWVHIAIVRNKGLVSVYFNGKIAGTSSPEPILYDVFYIGVAGGGGEVFLGDIDELRLFTFEEGKFSPEDLLFHKKNATDAL